MDDQSVCVQELKILIKDLAKDLVRHGLLGPSDDPESQEARVQYEVEIAARTKFRQPG